MTFPKAFEDAAQVGELPPKKQADFVQKGGIDLTPANLKLQTKMPAEAEGGRGNGGIKFHLDPVMFQQLQNAPGFTPVIVNIQSLKSLADFLGIKETIGNSQGVG